jgi:peptidoglycan/xylan/chitin deacetylase (PgdA/CDA1 family)
VIARGDPGGIYLTFDDGPDPDTTPRVLELLAKDNTPATFFVSGIQAEKHPDLVRAISAAGHGVASHGYHHRSLGWAGTGACREELQRSVTTISYILNQPPPIHNSKFLILNSLFRPPYGRFGPGVLKAAKELGLTIVLWSLSARDWKPASPRELADRIVTRVRPGDIILLHDRGRFAEAMLQALPEIIQQAGKAAPWKALSEGAKWKRLDLRS